MLRYIVAQDALEQRGHPLGRVDFALVTLHPEGVVEGVNCGDEAVGLDDSQSREGALDLFPKISSRQKSLAGG